jgi:hypothetical protein
MSHGFAGGYRYRFEARAEAGVQLDGAAALDEEGE